MRAAADVTVVCFEHEADRLQPRPEVVPLPVEPLAAPGPHPSWADRPTVGVLGFVYPGKGHREVLEQPVSLAVGAVARAVQRLTADDRGEVELRVDGARVGVATSSRAAGRARRWAGHADDVLARRFGRGALDVAPVPERRSLDGFLAGP